jgi:hypothetical protein
MCIRWHFSTNSFSVSFIFKNTTYRKGIGGEMPPDTHIKGSKGYFYLGETDDTNLQNLQK